MLYEAIDYNDPCAILMRMEGEEDERRAFEECLHAAGLSPHGRVSKPCPRRRVTGGTSSADAPPSECR